ncbi:nitrate- and nitrite sensing domain-containing protein [Actinocatenispora sera]|uniref:sensor histidine kinase n=1 Tax=Actinocatenispora sera TaxID=390989 RepID=UPI00340FEDDF
MSKRTAATQAGRQRRRRPIPRLSDVRIQSKLGLILVVPVLAVVALAGIELANAGKTLSEANKVDSTLLLSTRAGGLIEQLQNERLDAAETMMAKGRSGHSGLTDQFKKQSSATDEAIGQYQSERDKINDSSEDLPNLPVIDDQLDALTKTGRSEVLSSSSDATVASVTFRYQVLISELLDLRDSMTHLTNDRSLSSQLTANAALSDAKESAAQEQLALLRVINDPSGFDATSFETFLGTLTDQQSAYDSFNRTASDDQRQVLEDDVNGLKVQDSTRLETDARTVGLGTPLGIKASDWNSAMSKRIKAIRSVEETLDAVAAGHARETVKSVGQQVIAEAGAGLVVLVIAILLALLVARAMARSLRRLREGALQVAYEGLPQAVGQLETAESIGGMSPEEIAGQVRDPIQVRGRDEIGQVSEAFNVVHREAVRVAAAQAVLRASVSTMFINLARRSQLLVDRLIGHLDRLEQGEEDPDRLAQLFQLDHLATRMRRNDENLLVLAGADSTRARREAAPLGDVLRAAQSEVEQYTRIEFGVVDRDVEVEATAVNDVVHLVAELLDNATAFSSPDTAVVVDARRVGDRAIVQIEDRGIGMSGDVLAEVNERLANPPLVDVAVSRMMGLVVVGRLASRLGIKIELRPAPERGTVADVVLPAAVLVPTERPGVRPGELPTQGGPLALETGPGRATRDSSRPVAPEPADPMPGIPFQPPARDSLADAANGHRLNNGSSALPRRQPGQADEPTTADPTPTRGADEPIRRSLFDPPARKLAQEQTGSFDAPPPAAYQQPEPTAFEQTSYRQPEPQSFEQQPEPGPYQRATGAEPDRTASLRRDDSRLPASAADDTVTFDRIPAEPPRRSLDDSVRRAPQRPVSDPEPAGESIAGTLGGHDPWAEPPARPMADDLTVETPQLPGRDVWSPAEPAPIEPATAGQQRRYDGRSNEEISAHRGLDSATPEPEHGSGSGRGEIIPRNVDDTMELPIFREVESAWFRTSPSRPRTAPAVGAPPAPVASAARPAGMTATRAQEAPVRAAEPKKRPTVLPTRVPSGSESPRSQPVSRPAEPARRPAEPAPTRSATPPVTETPLSRSMAEMPPSRAAEVPSEGRPDIDPWRSAADKGWQAASAITTPRESDTTSAGLPIRRPMAQLVPGGIEEASRPKSQARERSPEAVRGLLSAYHRGVQRGRAGGGDSPRAGAAPGHRSTGNGAGEEQEA